MFDARIDTVRSHSASGDGSRRDGACRYEGEHIVLDIDYLPFGKGNTDLSSRWALYAYSSHERDVEMVDITGVARSFTVDDTQLAMRTGDAVFDINLARCTDTCARHDALYYTARIAQIIAEREPGLDLP